MVLSTYLLSRRQNHTARGTFRSHFGTAAHSGWHLSFLSSFCSCLLRPEQLVDRDRDRNRKARKCLVRLEDRFHLALAELFLRCLGSCATGRIQPNCRFALCSGNGSTLARSVLYVQNIHAKSRGRNSTRRPTERVVSFNDRNACHGDRCEGSGHAWTHSSSPAASNQSCSSSRCT